MKFGSLGAAIAAVSFGFIPVAHAQSATIEEVIQVAGDILALAVICPALDGNKKVFDGYMASNNITQKLMTADNSYADDVMAAKQKSYQTRKALSVSGNCDDALRLYGENGTVIKGFLFKKVASSN